MTHDPLCPYMPEQPGYGGINSGISSIKPYIAGYPCQCDLIAQVRHGERYRADAAIARVAATAVEQILGSDEDMWAAITEAFLEGQRDMLARCIEALEVEMETESDEDRVGGVWDAIVALRALQEKP